MFDKKTVISSRFKAVFWASMLSTISAYILVLTGNVVAGQVIGDDAVAAMTLIFPIFTMILFVVYLFSDGLVMLASYAQGKGDRAEVDRLFSLGIILSVSCGVIFFAAFFFLRDEILAFWEISPQLKTFAEEYYSGLIFLALIQFLNIFIYTIFFCGRNGKRLPYCGGCGVRCQRDFRYCTLPNYRCARNWTCNNACNFGKYCI